MYFIPDTHRDNEFEALFEVPVVYCRIDLSDEQPRTDSHFRSIDIGAATVHYLLNTNDALALH